MSGLLIGMWSARQGSVPIFFRAVFIVVLLFAGLQPAGSQAQLPTPSPSPTSSPQSTPLLPISPSPAVTLPLSLDEALRLANTQASVFQ